MPVDRNEVYRDRLRRDPLHVERPASLSELLALYDEHPEATLFAGGTAVMLRWRASEPDAGAGPLRVIDLGRVSDLRQVTRTERYLDIGACVPLSRIVSLGAKVVPAVLLEAVESVATPAIRNVATVGGGLCLADARSDCLAPLYALDAVVELRRRSGARWLSMARFLTGDGATALEPGEVLARVRIPDSEWHVEAYRRVAPEGALGFAACTFCGLARLQKGTISEIRLAFGGLGPLVLRDRDFETALVGRRLPMVPRERAAVVAQLRGLFAGKGRADALEGSEGSRGSEGGEPGAPGPAAPRPAAQESGPAEAPRPHLHEPAEAARPAEADRSYRQATALRIADWFLERLDQLVTRGTF